MAKLMDIQELSCTAQTDTGLLNERNDLNSVQILFSHDIVHYKIFPAK